MEMIYEVRAHQGAKEGDDKLVQVTLQTLDGKSTITRVMPPEEARAMPLWSRWQVGFTAYLDGDRAPTTRALTPAE